MTTTATKSQRLALASELSSELMKDWPKNKGGRQLIFLANNHFGDDRLLVPSLDCDKLIPYRYERPYPNFVGGFHDPDPAPLDSSNPKLVAWSDGRIYLKD